MNKPIFTVILIAFSLFSTLSVFAQETDRLPIKGFAIAAPSPDEVDRFVKFIDEELGTRGVNTLVLRVDYNYEFDSHPELRNETALSTSDVKKLVTVAKKHEIKLIPQINLLGHQSWAEDLENLLKVYPQFDETPHVKMPEKYEWPNEDGLYCKSYCPLHPEVHEVVFALMDEICEVFEADAFHAGMDEVFYIGDDKCPRCAGRDKAELFAGEVTKISNHLAANDRELWIWGDRLIDGKTTGLGMWEASMNNTHRAIDLIPKNVIIADWHYERPDQTAVLFAAKGLKVVTGTWRNPTVAIAQAEDMYRFRANSTPAMKENFYGIMQTVWTSASRFMDGFYANTLDQDGGTNTQWHTFRKMYEKVNEVEKR